MLKFIGINKEKEIWLSSKEYISGIDDMVAKCVIHMHNTAELKAYWLSYFV